MADLVAFSTNESLPAVARLGCSRELLASGLFAGRDHVRLGPYLPEDASFPIPIEPGVVLGSDAAGNVLQIIWPALAGLPAGSPVLRFNLAQWNPTIATGDVLGATMSFTARAPDGSTATFNVVASGMVVPVLR